MSWKLYKPGQGYWTRMASAAGAGVLVLGGAAWIWAKLQFMQAAWAVYLQGALALAIIGGLGLLVYRYVGAHSRSVEFLISTEGEMRKVNWPNRKEVKGSTIVVIWCVILLVALLYVSDVAFATFFKMIGVLES